MTLCDMKKYGYSCYVFAWTKIVGGYGEKGVSKQSTEFKEFYKYNIKKDPVWGNLVFTKKPMNWLFEIYTKHFIKKYLKKSKK